MSASDNSRPNQEKYQARNVAATNRIARNRIGFEPGTAIDSGRIDLVKHKINDHACNRHVQPQRQRDASDASVSHEVIAKRAVERKRHEWNNHDREDGVTGQDGEIDRTSQARALKTRRA